TTQTFGTPKSVNTGNGGAHALLTSSAASATGARSTTYQYDLAGRTTNITDPSGTTTLSWNGEDRLDSVTKGGRSTSYLYDADGNQLIR
ncbi:hypothetical protein, partial [Kitasatospora sp. MBT63]|uniref:hypothetical protein n=1 Tax=Kitasatospora sp. MBT63 TaxID=1444768 RepID=UPI0005396D4A